ncbi:uncharacterized protein LOC62_05G007441 [Vanrija pseudolonga]|uniref:Metallothionein n=1 Tax=Vanrija pseudolonga TaxID=143232 RepID=A0AAF1BSU2_9TREE|nr:hypothetical protein LOC62_05G007441 [Vanrija pseudolonga]
MARARTNSTAPRRLEPDDSFRTAPITAHDGDDCGCAQGCTGGDGCNRLPHNIIIARILDSGKLSRNYAMRDASMQLVIRGATPESAMSGPSAIYQLRRLTARDKPRSYCALVVIVATQQLSLPLASRFGRCTSCSCKNCKCKPGECKC